jgi:hypothetical protein
MGRLPNIYLANKTDHIEYNVILFMDKTGPTQPNQPIVIWNHDAAGNFQYPVSIAEADSEYTPLFFHNKGLDVAPQFVGEAGEANVDFHLKPASPFIGAGMATVDLDWGSSLGNVDLEAFGYGSHHPVAARVGSPETPPTYERRSVGSAQLPC